MSNKFLGHCLGLTQQHVNLTDFARPGCHFGKCHASTVQHTAEFFENFGAVDSTVCCTPRSSTPRWDAHRGVRLIRICPFFVFSYLQRLSTPFFRKTSEVKKIPCTICDSQYQFHINIFRHHREIAFIKRRIRTDT